MSAPAPIKEIAVRLAKWVNTMADRLMKKNADVNSYSGPLVILVARAVCKWPSFTRWITDGKLSANEKTQDPTRAAERASLIDMIVLGRLLLGLVLLLIVVLGRNPGFASWEWLPLGGASLLIVSAFRNVLRVALFPDADDFLNGKRLVSSPARIVLLGGINYIEVIISFATIYCTCLHELWISADKNEMIRPLHALYMSTMTQTTVGYGDIHPMGWLRFVACVQALVGMAILVLLVGQFVNSLPHSVSLRQELSENAGDTQQCSSA